MFKFSRLEIDIIEARINFATLSALYDRAKSKYVHDDEQNRIRRLVDAWYSELIRLQTLKAGGALETDVQIAEMIGFPSGYQPPRDSTGNEDNHLNLYGMD